MLQPSAANSNRPSKQSKFIPRPAIAERGSQENICKSLFLRMPNQRSKGLQKWQQAMARIRDVKVRSGLLQMGADGMSSEESAEEDLGATPAFTRKTLPWRSDTISRRLWAIRSALSYIGFKQRATSQPIPSSRRPPFSELPEGWLNSTYEPSNSPP